MTPNAIVGPVLADLDTIGGEFVTLATAFYSAGALSALDFKVERLRLLVRLNTSSVFEWATGAIDPPALCEFVERHASQCGTLSLFINPTAHAKVYAGGEGYLIGSANLSWRAFSGHGDEILWFEKDNRRRRLMDKSLDTYGASFRPFTVGELHYYIKSNQKAAKALAKKLPPDAQVHEDHAPHSLSRPARLGDYSDFRQWLDSQASYAAATIAKRADGAGNLSGHIRQNFFGLRQFFIGNPKEMVRLAKEDPDIYAQNRDLLTPVILRSFVQRQACDEGAFSLSTWRTYLPESAGGKPKSGGGTSGNLKRMLPLVAQYMQSKVRGR